jgi:hypothetical protein
MAMVLRQSVFEFWCEKANQRVFQASLHHSPLPAHEKMAFLIACLQIREGLKPVMVNQFASDFDIAEAISDGNLDEDSSCFSGLNVRKAHRNEDN